MVDKLEVVLINIFVIKFYIDNVYYIYIDEIYYGLIVV